jgi:protein-disulfide isomerase
MLRHAALALVLVAACSRADATRTTVATAAGSLAPTSTAIPQDSISTKADAGRIAGPASATLWVIMASDFQCPYCKMWHDKSHAAVMDYAKAGKVRIAFINMPLSMHQNAMPAAEAAMCAAVQNKFWPMHDALYASQDDWSQLPNAMTKFESIAGTIGIDMPSWRTCVTKHQTAALIAADRDRARAAGVASTPTFFVNGKMVVNADGSSAGAAADVKAAIEAALKQR